MVTAVFMLSNSPTPLYVSWQRALGFSSGTLTVIFALYIAGLLGTLLVAGQLSDRYGRKPVLLPGLAAALIACALFATASSVAMLAVARLLTGIAVGVIVSAGMASVIDLAGTARRKAALLASVAMVLGAGLGPLLAGIAAQTAAHPVALVFGVEFVILLSALAVALRLPRNQPAQAPGAATSAVRADSQPAPCRQRCRRVRAGHHCDLLRACVGSVVAGTPASRAQPAARGRHGLRDVHRRYRCPVHCAARIDPRDVRCRHGRHHAVDDDAVHRRACVVGCRPRRGGAPRGRGTRPRAARRPDADRPARTGRAARRSERRHEHRRLPPGGTDARDDRVRDRPRRLHGRRDRFRRRLDADRARRGGRRGACAPSRQRLTSARDGMRCTSRPPCGDMKKGVMAFTP
ncbi:hypothetical protein C7S13_7062 [Burkholderia cepacia]|nr:hypothetical protein [Burkholderia cepacia]